MSAYIVDNQTINRVVTYMGDVLRKKDFTPLGKKAKQYGIDLSSKGWETALATRMLEMNELAMHERYDDPLTVRLVNFEREYTPSRVQVLKSLQCFLYQCCEGDVDQMPLYRFLEEMSKDIALDIVMDLPAYDKAEWA